MGVQILGVQFLVRGPNSGGGLKVDLQDAGFEGPEYVVLSAGVVVHHASAWQLWLIGCPWQTSVGELQNLVYRPAHFGRKTP